jgi:hypothetical protein
MSGRPLRIIVLGMMGRCPYGGQTWLYLNWLRAFSTIGHDVYYVEDDTVWPYDPTRDAVTDDCTYAVQHIQHSMAAIGLAGKWAYRLADRRGACWGLTEQGLLELYRTCDVLMDVVGATDLRDEHMQIPLRVYVETDPVTAELRLANGDEHTREAFANHHVIVTYGENYGAPDCGVPLNGLTFKKTRQPVDLDLWRMHFDPAAKAFTTIGHYRQDDMDVEFNGEIYRWSKHHEWERFIDLPRRTSQFMELAMSPDDPDDRRNLESHGWHLVPPFQMSLDVFGRYPDYIRQSRAEFTVAKDQNVRLRSGWFSERDVCYLSSGKPVVTQETGFSNVLPTGEGLFGFLTMEEALEAIAAINADYERHCRGARRVAEEMFAAPLVGARLLRDIGAA